MVKYPSGVPRLSRQQQRDQTRQHLLDATVGCLLDYGYAGTTTLRIQQRAGLSRGALLHHFGSKADLLVAAIHYIAEQQLARIGEVAAAVEPSPGALRELLAALRSAMSGSLFLAGLELWVSARTDPALRDALLPAERQLGKALRNVFRQVVQDDRREMWVAYESLLMTLRGLALTSVLRDDPQLADDIVDLWVRRTLPTTQA